MSSGDGDEVFTAGCDLDLCLVNRLTTFAFAQHRQVQHYAIITR